MTANVRNLDYWRESGEHVLMAMPYGDEVIVEARGCTFRDADGKEYLDLASGMFCCPLGHNHPKFLQRILKQTEALVHTGTQFLSPPVFEAGRKLAEITPEGLNKTILFSTGTEANEFAFRVAKAYTGRSGIVGFSRGYYGTSLATKSCSSLSAHHIDSLPTVPETARIPITAQCARCFTAPTGTRCELPCFDSLESWMGDWANVAAVIVEPVLSAGGMLYPPLGYLKRLRELVASHGALFIVDEAQTGFGRTGEWFAFQHHGIVPDILTLSKSVGNGFPVAAVVTTSEIAQTVLSRGLWNLSSHQSDPVSAAAVCAVIDTVREERLADRARESGSYFVEQLRNLAERQPALGNVRGLGLMIGFDFLQAETAGDDEAVNMLMFALRWRGVHITYSYGGKFRIIPPLVITREQIDFAVAQIEGAVGDVVNKRIAAKDLWPRNPYTRQAFQSHPWKRLIQYCWRSSPEQLVTKGKEAIRQALRLATK